MKDMFCDFSDRNEINKIVNSTHDNPHQVLGPHIAKNETVIQAFIPTARHITVNLQKTKKEYIMNNTEFDGFFTVTIPNQKIPEYTLTVEYQNQTKEEIYDPYSYTPYIMPEDIELFEKGIHYTIYEKLGAHRITRNFVEGTLFAVWAPDALRVSVVGNFNSWDGRRYTMRRLDNSGIFELFIPGINCGEIYKYEIKIKGELITLKSDPYSNKGELRPGNASIVWDIENYQWKDSRWLENRTNYEYKKTPISIYEVHLGSWMKPSVEDREFYNYREIAPMLATYIIEMGYTHLEILPIMEHPFDGSWGYQVTGYYAPTSRFGNPEDFMYFIDYMHGKGIGVILDWVPAHFPKDSFGLAKFDGTCLYEHFDARKGEHPHWGTLIYNYGRPEVTNFLIANALFWIEKYHMDGIRMDAVASMLYLNYGKEDGEWLPNQYGSYQNLEAVEFIKHLNSVFKRRNTGAIIIAEESTSWPKITGDLEDDGLGFNLKWNLGWMNDFTKYMKLDPLYRKGSHGNLTFSFAYTYNERFVLVLSHDEVVHGKGSLINKMPGFDKDKFSNLRVTYGFMMTHPGKKLLFMGQEFAQYREWSESRSLDWELLEIEKHKQMILYVKELNHFYKEHPALFELDFVKDGFDFIRSQDADHSILTFIRISEESKERLFVVCNFTPVVYEKMQVGVPQKGKYKEIFNSDKSTYGGDNNINRRVINSKNIPMDGVPYSIFITVPPLGISIYRISGI